jgi:lipoyl(octanoyl) transferase
MKIKHKIDYINDNAKVDLLEAIQLMDNHVDNMINNNANGKIWFLEHNSVYTAGTGAKPEELLSNMFDVVKVGRGGKYTYHGPGQLVVYLMLDLKKIFLPNLPDLHKYIYFLEQWVINSLEIIGIKSGRRENRIGVWVSNNGKDEKICAIGVRVKKWISFHGIALNINPDLTHYNGIIPCGLGDYGVTSIDKIKQNITMFKMAEIMQNEFKRMFCE